MSDIGSRTLFNQKKSELAGAFVGGVKDARDTIASRSFTCPTGTLHDFITSAQIDYKNKLDQSVIAIMERQIEREMRLLGVSYSVEFRDAMVAFEIEKQQLLDGLAEELADLHRQESRLDADIITDMAETQLRSTIIIAFEAGIKEKQQVLLQQKNEAERLTFSAELDLINQQLVTATKRLELIPQLKLLVEAQKRVVAVESGPVYDQMQLLLAARQDLATLKLTLVDPLTAKAEAILAYATEQPAIIPFITAKATASISLANAQTSLVTEHQYPAAQAFCTYTSKQSVALPYMQMVANQRAAVAESELPIAQASIQKAEHELELANAETAVAEKYAERAQKLIDTLLPAQQELIDAINRDVEYRRAAAALRVQAADAKVQIANYSAQGVIAQVNIKCAEVAVQLAKLDYSVFEKLSNADLHYADARITTQVNYTQQAAISNKLTSLSQNLSDEVDSARTIGEKRIEWRSSVAEKLTDAEKDYFKSHSKTQTGKIKGQAGFSAKSNITVALAHTMFPKS